MANHTEADDYYVPGTVYLVDITGQVSSSHYDSSQTDVVLVNLILVWGSNLWPSSSLLHWPLHLTIHAIVLASKATNVCHCSTVVLSSSTASTSQTSCMTEVASL